MASSNEEKSAVTRELDYHAKLCFQEKNCHDAVRFYDEKWAKHYDQELKTMRTNGHNSFKIALGLLKQYEPTSKYDAKILDVAAGTGEFGLLLKNEGYTNLYGLDASIEMIKIAQSKQIYKEIYHEILEPNSASKLVPEKSLDFLFALSCFYKNHLEADHLSALLRMLKPGGKLIIGRSQRPYHSDGAVFGLEEKLKEMEELELAKIILNEQVQWSYKPELEQWVDGRFFVIEAC